MPRFLYKAKKTPTEVLEGFIDAESERLALDKLIQSGCYPIWIKEETSLSKEKREGLPVFARQTKTKDLADFTRQLSELLDSGLALFDALNIIEGQIENPQIKKIILNIKESIKDGNTFSESLKTHPNIFSNLYINLVKSGEVGGMLNEVLTNISDFLEKQEETKDKVLAALSYPMLMGIVGVITIFILMAFVIPRLVNLFLEMGQRLPLPTRVLIGTSNFIRGYWVFLVILMVALIILIKRGKSNKVTKKRIDRFILKTPIFGRLIKDIELARFSRTLSTLLKNGVPILNSLKITSDVVENEAIKEEVERIWTDVKAGSSLASAMRRDSSFPPLLVNMTAIGEEGGSIDKTLLKVAKGYENETDRMVRVLSSLLEPIMILIMGLIVGFIVISMLLPVFQISLTAH